MDAEMTRSVSTRALPLVAILLACLVATSAGAKCPLNTDYAPPTAIGSTAPQVYIASQPIIASSPGPAQTYCCRSGRITGWSIATTLRQGFVGQLGALCSDGSVLPSVTYGFNGTNAPTCDVDLFGLQVTANPTNNFFSYRAGLVLDAFLDSDRSGNEGAKHFFCPNNTVAIGFTARPNCYGLTAFQVACSEEEEQSRTLSPSTLFTGSSQSSPPRKYGHFKPPPSVTPFGITSSPTPPGSPPLPPTSYPPPVDSVNGYVPPPTLAG